MDQTLTSYIETCRSQGFSDDVIRQQLLGSGWDPAVVAEVLPVATIESAQPPMSPVVVVTPVDTTAPKDTATPTVEAATASVAAETTPPAASTSGQQPVISPVVQKTPASPRTVFIIAGVIFAALIVVLGGLVTVAEAGYIPAFSKLYRQTYLPLSWGGTVSDPVVTLAQSGSAFSNKEGWGVDSSLQVTIEEMGGSQGAMVRDVPFLSALARNDVVVDEANPALALVSSQDSMVSFPFTMSMGMNMYGNAAGSAALGMSLDVAALVKNQPGLADYVNKDLGTGTVDVRVIKNGAGYDSYLMTNILPRFEWGDASRWYPLASDTALESEEGADPLVAWWKELSAEQQKSVQAMLRKIMSDEGVQRVDGKAMAVHQMLVSLSRIDELLADQSMQSIHAWLREVREQFASSGIESWTTTYYTNARGGAFAKMITSVVAVQDGYKLTTQVEAKAASVTAVVETLSAPTGASVMEEPLEEYVGRAFVSSLGGEDGLVSTGILTDTSYEILAEVVLAGLETYDTYTGADDELLFEDPDLEETLPTDEDENYTDDFFSDEEDLL